MIGMLEELLRKRFGQPKEIRSGSYAELRWNDDVESLRCVLYKPRSSSANVTNGFTILRPVYGDALGASLLCGTTKVSMLQDPSVFGLYNIEELQNLPTVRRANIIDSEIVFFMDSVNVWYFGVKGDQLFVYDSATNELDRMGGIQESLEQLITEWEEAKS
jgi:hypothetical protein